MVVLDTHVLIYDALQPHRLSARARRAVQGSAGPLAISDITLWEIAMLMAKSRLEVAADPVQFMDDLLHARHITVLPITPKIAMLAQSESFSHGDPADRVIAATAIVHGAQLVSADARLRRATELRILW